MLLELSSTLLLLLPSETIATRLFPQPHQAQAIAVRQAAAPQFYNGASNRFNSMLQAPVNPSSITYKPFTGTGTTQDGWPDKSDWIDLHTMWFINSQIVISKSCDNSAKETSDLFKAINSVSTKSGVDARFILAIVMEESHGCVRVQTTSLAVSNPGLMQSYQGKGSCVGQTPCPYSEIKQMIMDGVMEPNEANVNLKALIKKSKKKDVSKYYMAARYYNSGPNSITGAGDLGAPGANACYVADIANRLLGYVGDSCGPSGAAAQVKPQW